MQQRKHAQGAAQKVREVLRAHAFVGELPGTGLRAYQAPDVFALWEAWERALGVSLSEAPFWATVWPAAWATARWLSEDPTPVRGKRVLELGCGGAVASIAAARAGARQVVANDIDAAALVVAQLNAQLNQVTVQLDNTNRAQTGSFGEAQTVLVADMFYERQVSAVLVQHLARFVEQGGEVWVADGGRPFAPQRGHLAHCEELPVNLGLEGARSRTVRIWRWAPGALGPGSSSP